MLFMQANKQISINSISFTYLPRSVSQMQLMPIPRVNRAAPSGSSLTFLKFPGLRGLDASTSSFSNP
jgi:hypothetical protein